jgi:DNA-binding NarL/FixJ family response regulator
MRSTSGIRPGLQKNREGSTKDERRILVADDDATRRRLIGALLVEKYAPAVALEASCVPTALEALLVRHPDLVVADLGLSGHSQGGFRLILDAASLGVPAVVTSGPISRALEERLAQLGVGWVPKGSSEQTLFAAIDRALEKPRVAERGGENRKVPAGPRMHTA